jgi:Zn-dependent protease with chaperone function
MARLRNIAPLNKAATAISDKAGRPWIEATFNAVRLGENQMPDVFRMAVLAARILALPHMPDVYVSGDRIWDAATYGSDRSSFIVLGTAIVGNFQGRELLFLLAREMGHCRAGHALWKTVIRVLLGQLGTRKGFAEAGLISALNPFQLLESTIELPLLAWARQAEITADRAGALAVGEAAVAQRALMTWSLKSAALLRKVSFPAWMDQLADDDEQVNRLSEVVSSSTPYITRRLKLMSQFFAKPEMERWGAVIGPLREAAWASWQPVMAGAPARGSARPAPARRPAVVPAPASPDAVSRATPPSPAPQVETGQPARAKVSGGMRLTCPSCLKRLEIPRAASEGKDTLRVRCPHPGCGRVMAIKPKKRESDDAQLPMDD